MARLCKSCRAEMGDKAKYCPECGAMAKSLDEQLAELQQEAEQLPDEKHRSLFQKALALFGLVKSEKTDPMPDPTLSDEPDPIDGNEFDVDELISEYVDAPGVVSEEELKGTIEKAAEAAVVPLMQRIATLEAVITKAFSADGDLMKSLALVIETNDMVKSIGMSPAGGPPRGSKPLNGNPGVFVKSVAGETTEMGDGGSMTVTDVIEGLHNYSMENPDDGDVNMTTLSQLRKATSISEIPKSLVRKACEGLGMAADE